MAKELSIPPVFAELPYGETVGVHDYALNANFTFDYVDERFIGLVYTGDLFAIYAIVRPIISPLDILDMLQCRACVCGAKKGAGRSHCSGCYYALPPEMQKALYRRFRAGYEQAFLASLIYLVDNGRTDVDRILAAVPKPKDGPK